MLSVVLIIQLSSPVSSRGLIGELQNRWTNRGSREATPCPDAFNGSPEGAPSPGTSPQSRSGSILFEFKEKMMETKEKLEEEMNKRKAARGGTVSASATHAEITISSLNAAAVATTEAEAKTVSTTISIASSSSKPTATTPPIPIEAFGVVEKPVEVTHSPRGSTFERQSQQPQLQQLSRGASLERQSQQQLSRSTSPNGRGSASSSRRGSASNGLSPSLHRSASFNDGSPAASGSNVLAMLSKLRSKTSS